MIHTNLDGTLLPAQEVGRHLFERRRPGSMVFVASVGGRAARPLNAHYGASKAGVLSLVNSAAQALAPMVRVNGVCRGAIKTPMLERRLADYDVAFGEGAGATYLESATQGNLVKRIGVPRDMSNAVAFLLSDRASFITGQSLNIDGGVLFN